MFGDRGKKPDCKGKRRVCAPSQRKGNNQSEGKKEAKFQGRQQLGIIIWSTNTDVYTIDKFHELKALLDSCTELEKPHIIALSEVKPKNPTKEFNIHCFNILGYNIEAENLERGGRGMLLYLRQDLRYIMTDITSPVDELQALEILLEQGTKATIISIYRSPNSDTENNDRINQIIRELSRKNEHTIIVGDFNRPNINWEQMINNGLHMDQDFLFIEAIRDSFLIQHVNQATRSRGTNRPSLLDLILTDYVQQPP